MILRGGPILTVDDAEPIGEALAIRGSTILEVGSLTEVKRHYTPATEIVDLEGRAVLPGFVEPHAHVLATALADVEVDRGAQGPRAVAGASAAHPDAASARGATAPELRRPVVEVTESLAERCAETLRRFAARGCTTVYDAGIGSLAGAAEHELLRALAHAPDAPVRLRGALTPELAAELGARPGRGDERFDVVGIAYWADGPVHERAAALSEPYLHGNERGRLLHDEARLREAMRGWHGAGWQLVVHAHGDRAVDQALRCFEAILAEGPARGGGVSAVRVMPPRAPVRHRLEHVTVAHDAQIAQAAALGLAVSHTINDVYFHGEALREEVLGPERAARIHSLRRDLDRGLASSCHSDSPVSPVDPCLALRTATTRLMRGSEDVLGPFQQVKLGEALRMVTCDAAEHVLLGDRVGALRPGMLADLVVLDRDPRAVSPERLHELRVTETWLGGRRRQWG